MCGYFSAELLDPDANWNAFEKTLDRSGTPIALPSRLAWTELMVRGRGRLVAVRGEGGEPAFATSVLSSPSWIVPGHEIWKRDFKGSSGIFSFVLQAEPERAKAKAHAFLDALSFFGLGYSWGGYESLALVVNLSDRTIRKQPIESAVIRLQIGLEDVPDLKKDLEAGFAAAAAV